MYLSPVYIAMSLRSLALLFKSAVFKFIVIVASVFIAAVTSANTPLTISNVLLNSQVLNLSAQPFPTIAFVLSKPADVRIAIFDSRDFLVKEIQGTALNAGAHEIVWDGTDYNHAPVPNDAYKFTIAASQGQEAAVHDLSDITGGERIPLRNFNWDADTNEMTYGLDKPAKIVVRVGLANNGPLLRTIIDWRPRSSGNHTETWDGYDASRVLELAKHPKLEFAVDAFSLPQNTLIVEGSPNNQRFVEIAADRQISRKREHEKKPKMYSPLELPAEKRGDFPLQLALVGDFPTDSDGVPVVSGTVPLRLNVEPAQLQNIASQRFEPVFYVDGIFVYENEVGFFPMTFRWDTRTVNPGVHYVTANLRGYLSNFGMATVKVIVGEPSN